ncbi:MULTISPECIES: SDR family oxidoreductase [Actinomadura]|uniref:SDR family oxidoreductase n=1 Tax=Actinomadura TaxID=1988 RepID=UPI001BE4C272|nr:MULTISPECIES: SDR family oxidoreductase [Actinomadura]MBT2208855.1 SDR family oxidoreductase [Actinomadura sp. NEAU-AAG7]
MTTASSPRTALITGGTTGIGLATARVLRDEGFAVVVTGQNPDTLAAAEKTLGDGVIVRRADARRPEDGHALATEVKDRFGKLDLVFLNAGIGRFAPIEILDEAFYDEHFDVNVKGQLFTLQHVLPLLGRGSAVIFNSALGAELGQANWSVYSATKGALVSLARTLAVELAPRGIRVNAIGPGPVDTPAFGKLGLPTGALDGFRTDMASRIPLGRIGTDEDVARTVAFLASPAAGFITGVNLLVDGGLAASA